jgi:hypothetical protein
MSAIRRSLASPATLVACGMNKTYDEPFSIVVFC